MELRKIQDIGGTYVVSLPKLWAKRSGLGKGSIVAFLDREDGCLIVDPKYKLEKNLEAANIFVSSYLEREITGKYLLGYDIIRLESKDRLSTDISRRVRETTRRLIGLEIVEENYYTITLQCLLEPSAFPPEKILRREYLFTSSMHKDVITALIEGDINLAKVLIERDDEVDRLYFLLVRILRTIIINPHLSEKLGLRLIDCLDYRLIASLVELIADNICDIAKSIINFSGIILNEDLLIIIKQLCNNLYIMHQDSINSIFNRNTNSIGKVLEAIEDERRIVKKIEEMIIKSSPNIISYVSSILSTLNKICNYCVDLVDLVIPNNSI